MPSLITAAPGTPEWWLQSESERARGDAGGDLWWAHVMRHQQGLPPVGDEEAYAWMMARNGYDWTGKSGAKKEPAKLDGGTGTDSGGGAAIITGPGAGAGTGAGVVPGSAARNGVGLNSGVRTDPVSRTGTEGHTDPGFNDIGGGRDGGPIGSGGQLPGYGISQTLNGFGIPGYETNPMVGGGSWEGTTWNGAPYSGLVEKVIPQTDVTNPESPWYRGDPYPKTNNTAPPPASLLGLKKILVEGGGGDVDGGGGGDTDGGGGGGGSGDGGDGSGGKDGTTPVVNGGAGTDVITLPDGTTSPRLNIRPAVPYQTSWYLQTYGGKQPPYINIHEQLGDSMKGIQAAKPGFNWASPEALSKLGGVGMPLGWTSMLGFTPGGKK